MKDTGHYSININPEKKIVEMRIEGTFLPEMADAFHEDYLHEVRPICTKDYFLTIDCTDMDIITNEMLPKLQISLAFYKKSEFKKIQVIFKKNPEIKRQLERVFLFSGIENKQFIIVEDDLKNSEE